MRRFESTPEVALFMAAVLFACLGYGLPRRGPDPYDPGRPDPALLRVVSWNVGGTGEGRGRSLADEHVAEVASTLRATDADLVFLFELASEEQLVRIARELGSGTRHVTGERFVGSGAIGRRGTLVALELSEDHARPPLVVLYRKNGGYPAVHAAGVHAHPWSARRRNGEIGRAVDLVAERSFADARILAGDLNLDLDRRGRNDLFTNDEHLDVETYNYAAERLLDAGVGAGPTAEPDRRLDYLFASDALHPVSVGVWRGRRAGDMDHHPLIGDFRFAGADTKE